VAELRNVSQQYKAAGIPLEVMWSDIDHMDRCGGRNHVHYFVNMHCTLYQLMLDAFLPQYISGHSSYKQQPHQQIVTASLHVSLT
jgi:hypothetical protein